MQKIKKISCILSDHIGIKLELNSKRNGTNIWSLNNILLNGQSVVKLGGWGFKNS
jgi:hypothetical protein